MKKRITAILLLLAILVSLLTACEKPSQKKITNDKTFASYKDIPGVTEELIEQVEAIKASRSSLSFATTPSTEAFVCSECSKIKGFVPDCCEWLSELFGIEFVPELQDVVPLFEGLRNETNDFVGDLSPTPERMEKYHMTKPIVERTLNYFYSEDHPVSLDEIDEGTMTFGFFTGGTASADVDQVTDAKFKTVFVDTFEEAAALLKDGTIDMFFTDGTSEANFDEIGGILTNEYYPLVHIPVSMTTKNDELKPIIEVINLYLEQEDTSELSEMYASGVAQYRSEKFNSLLTAEELAYIEAHNPDNPVLLGAEFDRYPTSFYNKNEKQWQGVSFDILGEISKLSGLAFKVQNHSGTPFAELKSDLKDGKLEMLTALAYNTVRDKGVLWPAEPYSSDNYALISKADTPIIEPNQILRVKIAVLEDSLYEATFDKWFPDHPHKHVYQTMDECFEALASGEVDYIMGSTDAVLSMTNYNENPNYRANIVFNTLYHSSFAFNEEETILASIISKSQQFVDVDAISNEWSHKAFDYSALLAKKQIPYLIILAGLLLLILALMAMLMRKNKHTEKHLAYLVEARTKELEVQTYNAQKASMAKSDFLSRMSHEIRTPLNAIIGMAQVQKQLPDLSGKARQSNEEILAASKHLLGLLNDILDMSKIESGKFKLENKPFALKKAIEEVVNMISVKSEEKSIRFTATTDNLPDVNVLGDKMRLKQVLINLLANAIKFSPENGQVTFSVTTERETNSLLFLHFSVTDTGCGISEEMQKRLFKPFEQANQSSSETTGSGLGLAISQNLVHNMGGQIKVDSTLGSGSSFSFTISLKKAKGTAIDEPTEITIPNLQGKTILVAEDILVNRVVLEELLKKTGIAVEVAVDGAKALERFKASKPGYYDIILMDIQMPHMNGYEVTAAIRALDREDARTVPIVAMTAFAYAEDIAKAKESGMTDHMAKPLEVNILWEILSKYVS
ncbi:ATP-binding protein [Ohessyouella blattaphilus]|uniref:Stage 0 sporulation protein A homolog n=1 Tax=Ohessyouella blattaphilus TaxID=2949333 RepID=A0ABT1EH17_9FIRM|nr:transporter substrate-binding domain-containing protein [Ohessyouella blattaphilus]MCP1109963.1 transporter substrate-binding domain-containing protein [Ohessyouella blattaphilus]MCR8563357.1 transporter substrate-binding domain-containing protein [Ohessyouella blattaphilus]